MASSFVVAKRYSKALLAQAGGAEGARALAEPFAQLAATTQSSPELQNVLRSPAFSADEKWKTLQSISEKLNLPESLQRFLKVLAFANRTELLVDIEKLFKAQVLELDAAVEAEVETAVPLSSAHAAQIEALIAKLVGKKVKLIQKVTPELVAGIRVSVLGKTLDSTLPASLESVHRELLQAEA